MFGDYFYHESLRKIVVAFGTIFNNINIQRKDLEYFFGKKVYLELFVKVNKNWRSNDKELKRFGYNL